MTVIVLSVGAIVFLIGFAGWAAISRKVSQKVILGEKAFQIAEVGNEYYRWHLAHDKEDYQDGQTWCCSNPPCEWCGPYVHDYKDKDDISTGQFSLRIKPPSEGSKIVTIESTGKVVGEPLLKRVIETKLDFPSFTKYVVVANDKMRFGEGTTIYGEIHSNDGIRFDGLAHNLVLSAKTTYDDLDYDACTRNSWAVHTCVSPADPVPPTPLPNRPDVFNAGRLVGVPAIDFTGLSSNLAKIKEKAQENGLYFAPSGALGYHIVLKTTNKFDVYTVTSLKEKPDKKCRTNEDGWGIWSIKNETLLGPADRDFPANGLIFVEDNLWVDGQIYMARITIASGKFPENPTTDTSIIINNNLFYSTYGLVNGDAVGLFAQKNINVGLFSENNLQIDAALIAKNGRVGRYYYNADCGDNRNRQSITINGMIVTNKRYGFSYICDGKICSGYQTRILNYDSNLRNSPPPYFPLTADQYTTISWREVP